MFVITVEIYIKSEVTGSLMYKPKTEGILADVMVSVPATYMYINGTKHTQDICRNTKLRSVFTIYLLGCKYICKLNCTVLLKRNKCLRLRLFKTMNRNGNVITRMSCLHCWCFETHVRKPKFTELKNFHSYHW